MSGMFWCIMLAQLTTSNVYYQFINFGTTYNQIRFGETYNSSKNYMAAIPAMVMVGLLVFSQVTEKFGLKAKLLVFSSLLSIGSMICLYMFPARSGPVLIVPYIIFSLFFAIYSSVMWPAVPMTVNKKMVGFAYGLINAANNIGLALYPFLFGYIN